MAKLSELNIHDFGNTIQLAGVIFRGSNQGNDRTLFCYFPDESNLHPVEHLALTLPDWKAVITQTDVQETEVLAQDTDGLRKIILRKSTRLIEQGISWKVFKRDGYKCRYCAKDDVPLTVDHLVLWEEGGPTIEENLVSACRKCNKTRGNMQYEEWLKSKKYEQLRVNLTYEELQANYRLIETLPTIPRRYHTRSR